MAATETLKTVIDVAKLVKEMVIEECAQVADAEYNEQARLATFHYGEGDYEAMDRRNAAAISASRIAAGIRATKPLQTS